ncbi:MAG TPA: polysaccharide pyruvyl transferase family protein [Phenylobacterium sp.]|jgi:polysaccharide pyruvyl transferase WcaK-like protein|uniref:polysaccharide pyruvyl transferase family protein n=1 Tax=Phenylobacterium sp. TaxID=1871053 RepID=UPI002D735194|nr:polysaccharide pyruvyl transferase family protein [Phenylobacterium sp.]HZZ69126.1 polysaccharide pyruvyl transferase family protein [Phenylobacterium sp.]
MNDLATQASPKAPLAQPDRRPIRIGLLWHSTNSGNLGVGALTLANMAIARDVAVEMGLDPKFMIFGMSDTGASYVPRELADIFPIVARSMLSPGGYWKAIGQQDVVLDIGAGDSFADIYSLLRFAYLWLTKVVATVRRKPLLLSPQTIGPFTKPLYRLAARIALRGAAAVVVRDQPSFDAMKSLAPKVRTIQSTDVAFALPFEDRSTAKNGPRIRVGINASGLLFGDAVTGRNRFALSFDYAELMRRFIADLLARGDVDVHLFAHVVSDDPVDDDRSAIDRLKAEFPAVTRTPDFAGPSEAKAFISSLDFMVSGRMHACIGALSALTAVVPIAYSRKFRGVFGMLQYPWLVDTQGSDTDRALAYLNAAVDRRAELGADAAAGMKRVQPLLDNYRAELRSLFAGVRKPA